MLDIDEPFGVLVRGLVLTASAVLWTVLLVRIVGLRAFSKMTAFDFVTTIAAGSLIAQAGTSDSWTGFGQAVTAIAGIFLVQYLLARARQKSDGFQDLIRNRPVLLMEDGRFLETAMSETRVSRSSIVEKLRQSNAGDLSKVRAVVLETTGNISVMTGSDFDPRLLEGVERIREE